MTVKLGQTFYAVPANRRDGPPRTVTVTKVGRTWATLSNGIRLDIKTGLCEADWRGASWSVYADEQAYLDRGKLLELWRSFTKRCNEWQPPKGVDEATLRQAADLLNIKLED